MTEKVFIKKKDLDAILDYMKLYDVDAIELPRDRVIECVTGFSEQKIELEPPMMPRTTYFSPPAETL